MRVGFIINPSAVWLGGVSYFLNLFRAVRSAGNQLEPVVLSPVEANDPLLAPFARYAELVYLPWMRRMSPGWFTWRGTSTLTGIDRHLGGACRQHGIELVSHAFLRFQLSPAIPCIAWIPDFQHRHLPRFFNEGERRKRDRDFAACKLNSRHIIFSSRHAAEDGVRFLGCEPDNLSVLHFTAWVDPVGSGVPASVASGKVPQRFFHLPNQMYAHKDHRCVIDAVGELARARRDIHIVCTGNTTDPNNPGHLASLRRRIDELGIADHFHILGIVDRQELALLMARSIAVINPSLFEGWSTTVEEAKSLGKMLVLSDIPVHLEQAPAHARYFPAGDAKALAQALAEVADAYAPDVDAAHMAEAARLLPSRIASFASDYASILAKVARLDH